MEHLLNRSWRKLSNLYHHCPTLLLYVAPFWIHLTYFIILSSLGFLALTVSDPKSSSSAPKALDVFFTSVSASTVSSMATVEMEVFSDAQLIIMALLMLCGGEVFTSMLDLQLMKFRLTRADNVTFSNSSLDLIEIGMFRNLQENHDDHKPAADDLNVEIETSTAHRIQESDESVLRFKCIRVLSRVVLCYLFVVQVVGSTMISVYMSLVQSAREVLKRKGLNLQTFSVFTTVSTFSNCGFVPTNENMMVFKQNPGLLLILIPQILLGNTLYPVCLYWIICFFKKITQRAELSYMLKNPRKLEYGHLLPGKDCVFLAATVVGFIIVQFAVFCSLEWRSEATAGLNVYEKLVGSLFQVVNSRHSGESVFDLSVIAPAILVLFTVMMYLPPYTSFSPIEQAMDVVVRDEGKEEEGKTSTIIRKMKMKYMFSQLSYLAIFIILICITERDKIREDPLNFNVLNIVIEVISAYGNVGFSTCYSCARQIRADGHCEDAWYGFVGRWSNKGKFILILVMLFGRLKKFNRKGGKSWKLS